MSAILAPVTASAAILAVVTFASNIFAVVTASSTILIVDTLASPGVGTCKVSPRCLTNITSPDVTPASVSVVPLIEYAETACSTPSVSYTHLTLPTSDLV